MMPEWSRSSSKHCSPTSNKGLLQCTNRRILPDGKALCLSSLAFHIRRQSHKGTSIGGASQMSAYCTLRTSMLRLSMSALGGKADISRSGRYVR